MLQQKDVLDFCIVMLQKHDNVHVEFAALLPDTLLSCGDLRIIRVVVSYEIRKKNHQQIS